VNKLKNGIKGWPTIRSLLIVLCWLQHGTSPVAAAEPDRVQPKGGNTADVEVFLPQKERLDDAGEALDLARRKLESEVKDARKRFRVISIDQKDGVWRCFFMPRLMINKAMTREQFVGIDYLVEVEVATGKATLHRK
jgi:hypothetical protein